MATPRTAPRSSRLRPTIAAAVTAALALGFTAHTSLAAAGDGTAAAPPSLRELAPGITDSARLSSEIVAAGTALDDAGRAVPTGTAVVLQAWPAASVLDALAIGESVKLSPVGAAVTDSAGRFELRYSDPELLRPYVSSAGLVDLEVVTTIAGQPSVRALSYPAPASILPSVTAQEIELSGARNARPVDLRPGSTKIDVTPEGDAGDGTTDLDPAGVGTATTSVQEKTCVSAKIANLGSRPTIVGRAFTVTGATAKLTYTAGATSELGVGVSATGSKGSFNATGTSSVDSESVTGFPKSSGISGRIWKTDFRYAKFRVICTTGQNAQTMYEARATAHDGGATASIPSAAPTVKSTNCKKYNADSDFTKSTTKATGFSGGVSITSAIGINLSSKTGYSTKASVHFHFSKTLRLCGTAGLPADKPGTLVARPM